MKLSPREKDKLLVSMAAGVAHKRKERGVKLNYPEAVALITDFVIEGARDGRSVADLMKPEHMWSNLMIVWRALLKWFQMFKLKPPFLTALNW